MPYAQAVASRDIPQRHFVINNRYEHLHAATVRVVSQKGYRATSVRDICTEAYISPASFARCFSSKEEAVLMAVEAGVDQFMADCQAAFEKASSWPDAVWDGIAAFTEWSINEPEFARTAIVELPNVGPRGLELLHSLMDTLAMFIQPGYQLLDGVAPGELDAQVTGQVFEVMHAHLTERPRDPFASILPQLVHSTLVPFLGAQVTDEFIAWRQTGLKVRRSSAVPDRPTHPVPDRPTHPGP